jgi:hypothetical protein
MPIACWIPKATNTHSGYVLLIAFPLQQIVTRTRLDVTLYVRCLSLCDWSEDDHSAVETCSHLTLLTRKNIVVLIVNDNYLVTENLTVSSVAQILFASPKFTQQACWFEEVKK